MNAGATPKVTRSASESSCAPSSLVERVMRATEPSTASHAMPMKMSAPAIVRLVQPHGPEASIGLLA